MSLTFVEIARYPLAVAGVLLLLAIQASCRSGPTPRSLDDELVDHPANINPVVPENVPTRFIEADTPTTELDVEPFDASEFIDPELLKEENRSDSLKGKPSYDLYDPEVHPDALPEEDDPDMPNTSDAPDPWEWVT